MYKIMFQCSTPHSCPQHKRQICVSFGTAAILGFPSQVVEKGRREAGHTISDHIQRRGRGRRCEASASAEGTEGWSSPGPRKMRETVNFQEQRQTYYPVQRPVTVRSTITYDHNAEDGASKTCRRMAFLSLRPYHSQLSAERSLLLSTSTTAGGEMRLRGCSTALMVWR